MFEKRLVRVLTESKYKKLEKFYIITNRKSNREIYFKNSKDSLDFIKPKFKSPLKKKAYLLIKRGFLQLFLKKIYLPKNISAVFIGEQIKCFDLKNKKVYSFPLFLNNNKDFINKKIFQKKVAEEGFAPKIMKIDLNIPFSVEELLPEYPKNKINHLFRKLVRLYNSKGIKKISYKKYKLFLLKKMKKNINNDPFIENILSKINFNERLLIVQAHGDFSDSQVLIKNGEPVFVDWNPKRSLITEDLVNFFRLKKDFFYSDDFETILRLYPIEVKDNIKEYVILTEIERMINEKSNYEKSKEIIQELIN